MRTLWSFTLVAMMSSGGAPTVGAQEIMSEGACSTIASIGKYDLMPAWRLIPQTFKDGCNANPAAPGLFPKTLSNAVRDSRIHAYCEFNPVLRLCIVCKILGNASADLKSEEKLLEAFEGCRSHLDSPREKDGDFRSQVLGE